MANLSSDLVITDDVLLYHDVEFYRLIQRTCGDVVVEMMKAQEISSVDSLLRNENIFSFFDFDSDDLLTLKAKIGIYLNDGSFKIKPGITIKIEKLVHALRSFHGTPPALTSSTDTILSATFLQNFPFIQQILNFVQTSEDPNNSRLTFLYKFIENTFLNLTQATSRFRYDEHVKRFGLSVFLLGGRNLYGFIRSNLPGSLPSIPAIQTYISETSLEMEEGIFRYDLSKHYLLSKHSKYAFCSEDATAVIPKIVYDSRSDTFIGFSSPLLHGFPRIRFYSTNSFAQLETWFTTENQSRLLNIYVVQPLQSDDTLISPYLLAAYGTDGQYSSKDVILRWAEIFEQFRARGIRIIGFSTDCDSKYLRAMRIITGFFAFTPNWTIHLDHHAFSLSLASKWSWFFLRPQQLFICLQDPIHLITKLRNRLLSSKARLLLGNHRISIDFLLKMIETFSKLDHGLVKSDIVPKDRQNYSSCQKLSGENVLDTLKKVHDSAATCVYLKVSQNKNNDVEH